MGWNLLQHSKVVSTTVIVTLEATDHEVEKH
ncbi:uncharacterized protein G2W53_022247 [Senna tora]|uniref:Uncharacterized protein n=1 Tax=Senna tora TaxID=362788 RepID=A0A834WKA8_9FABA|nr:uncharacterized protein G2W53_022247 [Senna tora]